MQRLLILTGLTGQGMAGLQLRGAVEAQLYKALGCCILAASSPAMCCQADLAHELLLPDVALDEVLCGPLDGGPGMMKLPAHFVSLQTVYDLLCPAS